MTLPVMFTGSLCCSLARVIFTGSLQIGRPSLISFSARSPSAGGVSSAKTATAMATATMERTIFFTLRRNGASSPGISDRLILHLFGDPLDLREHAHQVFAEVERVDRKSTRLNSSHT